jgi:hypothetical protein
MGPCVQTTRLLSAAALALSFAGSVLGAGPGYYGPPSYGSPTPAPPAPSAEVCALPPLNLSQGEDIVQQPDPDARSNGELEALLSSEIARNNELVQVKAWANDVLSCFSDPSAPSPETVDSSCLFEKLAVPLAGENEQPVPRAATAWIPETVCGCSFRGESTFWSAKVWLAPFLTLFPFPLLLANSQRPLNTVLFADVPSPKYVSGDSVCSGKGKGKVIHLGF